MIIWMLLGQILYTSVLSAHTIANQEKQSILQSLVKRQVLYDDSISIDSVITGAQLERKAHLEGRFRKVAQCAHSLSAVMSGECIRKRITKTH